MTLKKINLTILSLFLVISLEGLPQKLDESGYVFTTEILLDNTEVKNQQHTGTCWSYCTTSFIESELIRQGKPVIDLSEMFSVRVQYVEKAKNYVLRQGAAQFSEGGLSHDVMNSISKYGIVPESVFPGNKYDSGNHNHEEMVAVLESELKTIITNPNHKLSTVWLQNIEGTLNAYLGEFPSEFAYKGKKYTPKSFAQYLNIRPEDYITFTSFTNAPFYQPYILQVPDNWANGSFQNLPMPELLDVIDNALKNGYTLAWDADVSERTWSRKYSIAILPEIPVSEMTSEQKSSLFKTVTPEMEATQEKRQAMFLSYETTDDHLMHIIGTAKDQNGNLFYIVKNSWGTNHIYDGYVYVSRTYMAMKTMGIMVHKDGVSKDILKK